FASIVRPAALHFRIGRDGGDGEPREEGDRLGDQENHQRLPDAYLPDDVLLAVADAVRKWGEYPLNWVKDYDGAS
ncbi:MAG: hypothetical protein COZ06_37170, partial [Armatimonadetes bacterium CG_4_10_14_3_um_filter_66_18]